MNHAHDAAQHPSNERSGELSACMTMFYLVHENVCLHYDNVCLYPSRTGSVDEHWDDRARRAVLWSGAHLSHRTHARKKLSSTRQPLPAWQSRRVDAHREQAVQRRVSARLHDAGAQLARAACTA